MTEWQEKLVLDYGVPAVTVLGIAVAGLIVASWTGRLIRRTCDRAHVDPTLAKFFAKLSRSGIVIVAVLLCLEKFGIRAASFAVVLGAAGLAIGLAFQGTLSNFAAGVMLLIFRPFRIGDVVNVGGQLGKVDEIDLFNTIMDTPDNRRIIVPNGTVFGSTIENMTRNTERRIDVPVGVSYGADIDATRDVLQRAAAGVPGRLADRDVQILLTGLGDSAVTWEVRVWCKTADFIAVRDATIRAVKTGLDAAGIGIPLPQMDVHVMTPITVTSP